MFEITCSICKLLLCIHWFVGCSCILIAFIGVQSVLIGRVAAVDLIECDFAVFYLNIILVLSGSLWCVASFYFLILF